MMKLPAKRAQSAACGDGAAFGDVRLSWVIPDYGRQV
jgi:hypothetical protein